jgi:formyltetrahydrofolate-dependent phosphoribosylglycinamide formyltransferase
LSHSESVSEVLNIAVFASGRGSNFEAILRAIEAGTLHDVSVAAVISNNSSAPVLAIARERNLPTYHLSQKQYPTEIDFDDALLDVLDQHRVNFIVLAGYMKKLSPSIVRRFPNRILNIHPALLPNFGGPGMYGMYVHEAVLKSGAKTSGATVHIVDEEYDHGPIVLQRTLPVEHNETPETLAAKIHAIEHLLYPEAIQLFADDRVRVINGRVEILEHSHPVEHGEGEAP